MQVPRPQATSSSSRNSTRKEPEKFRATKAPSSRGTGLLAGQKPPSQGSRPATTESESRSGRKETKDFQTTRTTETQVHPPHGFATVEKQERSSQSRTERPSEASSNHDSDASSSESSAPSLKAFSGDHLPRAPTSYPHSHPQPLPPHPSSSLSERQNHGWTQQISIYIPAASKPSQQHSESPPPSFMPSPSAGSELSLPLSSLNGIPSNFGYIHSAPTNSQSVSSPMSMMSMPSPPGMASPEGGALYRGYEESLVGSVRSGRLQSTVKSERRDRDYR
ncbi:hypothetical protein BKA70DRAFT_1300492 [Coprinopsis sp. MPI-PUGE-AT-0042]|nr:hypothetical protein BKA70DRAFT_1300492 [Coprinopsis sp. MPI-PUGE-AT-0042]